MRTLSAILLVAVSLINADPPSGKHNAFIADKIRHLNVDDYILKAEISVPDVVVNRYIPTPTDLKERLIAHVQQAAKDFAEMSEQERDKTVVNLPKPDHSSQVKFINNNNAAGRKREAASKFNMDATAALYKQALEFLDKYDVELRLD